MTDHYFTGQPSATHHPLTFETVVRGMKFTFHTDSGVFSKNGLDYGTRLLIDTVELAVDAHVVDLGCGYGPVTAVLSKIYPDTTWHMIDVNERAIKLAAKNVSAAKSRVVISKSDGFSDVPVDVYSDVLLNPPIRAGKATVYRLFDEACARLTSSGSLWVVMHKKHGADSSERYLRELFTEVERVARDAGYRVYRCSYPKAAKV